MARLWDKGKSLDERILGFTAGEDHLLDARLVEYDVRASIAHARMLEAQGLLEPFECSAIAAGLEALERPMPGESGQSSLPTKTCTRRSKDA